MAIDILYNSIFNLETFHRFNFFLGTSAGELLRRFIELLFYFIILYMIISEYKRNRRREYKYLIVGFLSLSFRQAFMSLLLFSEIFSVIKFQRFDILIGFLDIYLETIALVLLIGSFLFPAFIDKTLKFQQRLLMGIVIVTLVFFGSYIAFKANILNFQYTAILNLIQIFVLMSPFFIITRGEYKKIKYSRAILLAFFIYLLAPLIGFMSTMLFGFLHPRWTLVQRPLPFLSILLLIRTVYLKLVDKAFLRIRLRKSEARFRQERELNKLKDHFISIVSHELRTPLTSIKLYLSLLFSGKFGKVNKKVKKALKTLHSENDRLSDLITNLLTINRIEAHKIELDREEFNFKNIIDELYINIAESRGIIVKNKVKNLKVNADKKLVKQVYINLINNAIKFSDRGGIIEICNGGKKGEWWFSVRDTGIGIESAEVPKLFNKFYQVDNTLTRKNQGIGLGLAIVKNIVELHGGKVVVNSEIGKGAIFKVSFK